RYLGVVEAVGSSPVTPTIKSIMSRGNRGLLCFLLLDGNVDLKPVQLSRHSDHKKHNELRKSRLVMLFIIGRKRRLEAC
ncbi:MAG: hypothetical protein ACI4I7_03545, partial [Oscillospiraceae bacterium]